MKTILSKYQQREAGEYMSAFSNFELAMFKAYSLADELQTIQLQRAFPKLFIPQPKRGDEVTVFKAGKIGHRSKRHCAYVVLDSPIFEEHVDVRYILTLEKDGKFPEDQFCEAVWSFENKRWEI